MSPSDWTEEQWQPIDEDLFAGRPLMAVKRIRQQTGSGLHAAGEVMRARYESLRRSDPDRFQQTDAEYWAGWYS
ncbi:hypothetical protein OJF2_60360 [Aquisphaera giovannonii]|uniref:Uncharacterized protein n=1 Tax=Aquisphaera giovannonii TaxID=406548 RepID=A0A5B9WBN7_9BACT|nr:hypothetical protein OJF2_60360 [Aquisphaera giovannonii]